MVLQTRIRTMNKRFYFVRYIVARRKAVFNIQRVYRGHIGRNEALSLRAQRSAEWEQLFEPKYNVMYYFNKVTGLSSYEMPNDVYRPLVRDLKSDRLVQSWPDLESTYGAMLALDAVIKNQLCLLCHVRKAVRTCLDCLSDSSVVSIPTLFCFSCFSEEHSLDPDKCNHAFTDLKQQQIEPEFLACCNCDKPAVRKCLGALDDIEIETICLKLQSSGSSNWMKILQAASVGGERKLSMLMDQIVNSDASLHITTDLEKEIFLNATQLQQVRMALESTRAECDELFCEKCYLEMHNGGKRGGHKWIGFLTDAVICSVCTRSPAENKCIDCNRSDFCKSCFKVVHSKGKKKKHKYQLIKEPIEIGQDLCKCCDRRVATERCHNCSIATCNSCYESVHVKKCDADTAALLLADKPPNSCAVCGERANQKCVQCNDLYCSRTWMGMRIH